MKTSYNTIGGVHQYGKIPFRKNFGSVGYKYREDLDGFIAPQPYNSWLLDTETGLWYPPIAKPTGTDDVIYIWDESIVNWESIPYGINTVFNQLNE